LHRHFTRTLFVLALLGASLAYAQSTNATISGSVVDPSGKVLTDAIIEVANEATGIQYNCTTNHDGIYTLSILPPGEYRIQASKPGFKTLIKAGMSAGAKIGHRAPRERCFAAE
jgi:protocatechuate 3,4-dioxygenase beta subunit